MLRSSQSLLYCFQTVTRNKTNETFSLVSAKLFLHSRLSFNGGQARSQVLRFEGEKYIFKGEYFCFCYVLIKNFLGQQKLGVALSPNASRSYGPNGGFLIRSPTLTWLVCFALPSWPEAIIAAESKWNFRGWSPRSVDNAGRLFTNVLATPAHRLILNVDAACRKRHCAFYWLWKLLAALQAAVRLREKPIWTLVLSQIDWLNFYHQRCLDVVGAALQRGGHDATYQWLVQQTRPMWCGRASFALHRTVQILQAFNFCDRCIVFFCDSFHFICFSLISFQSYAVDFLRAQLLMISKRQCNDRRRVSHRARAVLNKRF